MRRTTAAAIAALLAACSGGSSSSDGPSGPFQFRTAEQVTVSIDVQKLGGPVAGATVAVVETYDPNVASDDSAAEAQKRVFFEGGSSAEGRCAAMVSIPTELEHVDVVVQHAGSEGPWTNEALRERWGPFAPSARVTVPVGSLNGLTIALEDR